MTARYLLCPGPVRSRADGDRHHISANQLAFLYGVRLDDCTVMPQQRPENHRQRMALLERARTGELVALTPRGDGDYRLPVHARPYGCHNRAPYKPVTELRDHHGRLVASWPFRMATACQYTHTALGQADARCQGCRWRHDESGQNQAQSPSQ